MAIVKGGNQMAEAPVGDTRAQETYGQRFAGVLCEIHSIAGTYGRQYLLGPNELRIALETLVRIGGKWFDRRRLMGSTEGGAGIADHQVAPLAEDRFKRGPRKELDLGNLERALHTGFSKNPSRAGRRS